MNMKKILFVTSDRRAAQAGAHALERMAPGSSFTWTQTPESALRWLQTNPDAAAVVIEAETESAGASFRDQVRRLATGARVIVVAPGRMQTWLAPSGTGVPRVTESPAPQVAAETRRSEKLTVALQGRLLELENALDESRRAQTTEQRAAAERLAQHESDAAGALAQAAAAHGAIEKKLADSIVSAAEMRQRADADLQTAAFREGALRNQVAQATAAREILEQTLAASEAARADADRRHAARVAEALARVNDLQTRYDAVLAIHATARVRLEQQLADSDASREQLASEAADAAARGAALEHRLAGEAMTRETLERNLRDAEAARVDAERRHAAELAESAGRVADLRKAYDAARAEHTAARAALAERLSQQIASRERVERQLADAEAATQQLESAAAAAATREAALSGQLAAETASREETEQALAGAEAARKEEERRHAREFFDAAAHLHDLKRTYETALSEHEAARAAFERQLADAEAARQQLESEAAAGATREAVLSEQLAAETAAREATGQKLTAAEAARADAEHRHTAELANAAAHLDELESAYAGAVAEHAAACTSFEQQLTEASAIRQDLVSQAAAAAEREAALVDALARETAARGVLEEKLAAAERARVDEDRHHTIGLAEAAARLAELQSMFDAAQAAHAAARAALEQELADAATDAAAAAQVRRDLESAVVENRANAAAAHRRLLELAIRRRRRTRELAAQLATQLDDERTEARRALATKDDALCESQAARARLSGEYDQARQSLDHLGVSFAALERVAAENAAERARLENLVAERDAQLRMQVERHLTAERTATGTIEALRQELAVTGTRAASLERDAERAAVLQHQLDEALRESRRLFERAPYGLCRVMPDGTFIKANQSFARFLGYHKADDIRSVSPGTVFECAADLRWVVERARRAMATAIIETALKTKDGRRLEARLHAISHADGTVDLAMQDISDVRTLEARLGEARRMEAVGRLASEVAVTCELVLRDVTDGGRAWLAAIDNQPELQHRGEMLLGEVTRAAGFLRDFSVYGKKQMRALERVSVQQMIRNLAPVLKRVAGQDVEWVLPKVSRPIYVDVDSEQVDRLLVNVASYARQRMPHSGQVKIDVAPTVLGHDFIAKYPNVRPGAHALITIAEVTRGRPAQRLAQADPAALATSGAPAAPSIRTGVDLGALLALVGGCGGHLWIAAEQSGSMTLKIHLPRRTSDAAVSAQPASPPGTHRVRQLAGWFRH